MIEVLSDTELCNINQFTLILVYPHIRNHILQPVSVFQLQILGLCNQEDQQ